MRKRKTNKREFGKEQEMRKIDFSLEGKKKNEDKFHVRTLESESK